MHISARTSARWVVAALVTKVQSLVVACTVPVQLESCTAVVNGSHP